MIRDGPAIGLVGRGGQDQPAPGCMFLAQEGNEVLDVGQVGRVEGHTPGDLALQLGLAAEEPKGQRQGVEQVAADEDEGCLHRDVGGRQGPVQVGEERHLLAFVRIVFEVWQGPGAPLD